jgi:transcriptional regulator with XRE-family HTH domain
MENRPTASEAFARHVSEIRKERGWSQQRLADELVTLGVKLDRAAIAKIEHQTRKVSIDEMVAFADALHVHPGRLLRGAVGPDLTLEEAREQLDRMRDEAEEFIRELDARMQEERELIEEEDQ